MTAAKVKVLIYFTGHIAVSLAVLLLQSTGVLTLNIGTASVALILNMTVYAGFYFKEFSGALFGFAAGALLDTYSSTLCYNTVAMTVFGFCCGLLITRLFNKNLAAAVVLSVGTSITYFFIKWLAVYAFNDPASGYVLLHFSLPSAIYTAAAGIAIYPLLSLIYKKLPDIGRH